MSSRLWHHGDLEVVVPYAHTFRSHAKKRWVGRTLLDVLMAEFSNRDGASPADMEAYFRHCCKVGLITINAHQVNPLVVLRDRDLIAHTTHRHEPPLCAGTVDLIRIIQPSVSSADEEKSQVLSRSFSALYVVVDKPSGLPVHPSGRYNFLSLTSLLPQLITLQSSSGSSSAVDVSKSCSISKPSAFHVVHRLDAATSGAIVFAGDPRAAAAAAALVGGWETGEGCDGSQDVEQKALGLRGVGGSSPHVVDVDALLRGLRRETVDGEVDPSPSQCAHGGPLKASKVYLCLMRRPPPLLTPFVVTAPVKVVDPAAGVWGTVPGFAKKQGCEGVSGGVAGEGENPTPSSDAVKIPDPGAINLPPKAARVVVGVSGAKCAATLFVPLVSSKTEGSAPPTILCAAVPITGRTHQIRLHANYVGCGLVGDALYSPAPVDDQDRPSAVACGRGSEGCRPLRVPEASASVNPRAPGRQGRGSAPSLSTSRGPDDTLAASAAVCTDCRIAASHPPHCDECAARISQWSKTHDSSGSRNDLECASWGTAALPGDNESDCVGVLEVRNLRSAQLRLHAAALFVPSVAAAHAVDAAGSGSAVGARKREREWQSEGSPITIPPAKRDQSGVIVDHDVPTVSSTSTTLCDRLVGGFAGLPATLISAIERGVKLRNGGDAEGATLSAVTDETLDGLLYLAKVPGWAIEGEWGAALDATCGVPSMEDSGSAWLRRVIARTHRLVELLRMPSP